MSTLKNNGQINLVVVFSLFVTYLLTCFSNYSVEGFWVFNCEGREDLSVEFNVLVLEHWDKSTVLDSVFHQCGIDSDSPETTKVVLFVFTVRKRVGLCVVDRFASLSFFG